MSKIRTLLVDDEPLAIRGLTIRLEPFSDLEIVGTCSNGREAVKVIKEQNPTLCFLIFKCPALTGFLFSGHWLAKRKSPSWCL